MRDEITLSEAIEQTKFGYPHFACPDGWLDCDAARVVAESLFDPTPLDLAVLREELGEPGTTDAWELDDQGYAMWLVADVLVMHHWRLGNEFSCRSASVAEKIVVTTLGQLRRILSVIKEQEAAIQLAEQACVDPRDVFDAMIEFREQEPPTPERGDAEGR